MRIKLLAILSICLVPIIGVFAAKIRGIALYRTFSQVGFTFIFISPTGDNTDCSYVNPCSESVAAAYPVGTVVYLAVDGIYSFGPRTNAISAASCTDTNCVGVWSFVLE